MRRKYKKQAAAAILSLTVALTAACSPAEPAPPAETEEETAEEKAPEKGKESAGWINSNIAGNVTADTDVDLKDDFHAAVNRDWFAAARLGTDFSVSSLTERNDEVAKQIQALLESESENTPEERLVHELYREYTDMERRNELGLTPLSEPLSDIEKIRNLEDLNAYMDSDDFSMADAPIGFYISADLKDSRHNALYLEPPHFVLEDADEYRELTESGALNREATKEAFRKITARLGWTGEEADSCFESVLQLETEIASACMGTRQKADPEAAMKGYNPVSGDELIALSPVFPVKSLLAPFFEAGTDRFILTEPEWLAKMNELYTEENVEAFKDMLTYTTIVNAAGLLDEECREILTEMYAVILGNPDYSQTLEEDAYEFCSGLLGMQVGKMYADRYVTEETKADITEIIREALSVYRKRLENNSWLSDETRKNAIEKLDSMTVRAAFPDDWSHYDCSDYVLPENGTLIEDVYYITDRKLEKKIESLSQPIDSDFWITSPQTVNAFYNPTDNSINIPAGILGGCFYDPESSDAARMGAIGTIIGHEITHGFDSTGSLFDKDGNLSDWWTEEDRAAFEERTRAVGDYYASIEVLPGKYMDGSYTIGETVADLGGMSCMLEIAKETENFDYEDFFLSYSKMWRSICSETLADYLLTVDTHAPDYLRVNVNIQQFEEFYETFDIKEGDGMYLAPEDRLSVW